MKRLYESLLDDEEDVINNVDLIPLIDQWLKKHWCFNYNIDRDGLINLNGSHSITIDEEELPSYINLGKISGMFSVHGPNLKSLRGFPKEVGAAFQLWGCHELKSLKGMPEKIGGGIAISRCEKIKNLEGLPKKINIKLLCDNCKGLESLKGCPKKIFGSFECGGCDNLKTLKDGPDWVESSCKYYHCYSLTSLEGAPKYVGDNFNCYGNHLESLKGVPNLIKGDFDFHDNPKLKTLEYFPKQVLGEIIQ